MELDPWTGGSAGLMWSHGIAQFKWHISIAHRCAVWKPCMHCSLQSDKQHLYYTHSGIISNSKPICALLSIQVLSREKAPFASLHSFHGGLMYPGIVSFCHIFWISLNSLNIFLTIFTCLSTGYLLLWVSHFLEENKAKTKPIQNFEVMVPDFFTPSSGFWLLCLK